MPSQEQPGNLWCDVNNKALSNSWAHISGFSQATRDVANAGGSILNVHHTRHIPMIVAASRSDDAPWLGGGGNWMQTIKDVLGTVVGGVKAAHEAGLTKAVANAVNWGVNRARGGPAPPAVMGDTRNSPMATDQHAAPSGAKRRFVGGASFGF